MSEIKYTAGLYLRLSKDDERAGESVSIENQRLLLTKYVEDQGWDIAEIYIDDGWRGVHFNRPGFQKMMQDVKDKRINVVVVKDLSRLGRNYVEMGRLMDDTLPELGCRFIAVNDYVDTINGDNDIVPYKNLFNEYYSKDTSKKVRTVKRACMEQGKYLGTYAPFGYRKDPSNKYHLIIDDETAHIVRRMYQMRCQGNSFRSIASVFNEERIPSPKEIYYSRAGRKNPVTQNGIWNANSIKLMLRSEIYIGNTVQGKFGTVSYKNPKLVNKAKDEWVRVANTHEPLIDMQTWETVCSLDKKGYSPRRTSKVSATSGETMQNMFTGVLKCADCGFTMRKSVENSTHKDGSKCQYISYFCGNYSRSGKSACTAHIIYEAALSQLILNDIRCKAQSVVYDEQRVIDSIVKVKNQDNLSFLAMYKQELKSSELRIAELDTIIKTLYEDRVNGVVTDVMFKNLVSKYETEREEKEKSVKVSRKNIEYSERASFTTDLWINTIRKYAELETLSQDILIELIDKIEVFEAERIGTRRICKVKIFYRFVGDVNGNYIDDEEAEVHEQAV